MRNSCFHAGVIYSCTVCTPDPILNFTSLPRRGPSKIFNKLCATTLIWYVWSLSKGVLWFELGCVFDGATEGPSRVARGGMQRNA